MKAAQFLLSLAIVLSAQPGAAFGQKARDWKVVRGSHQCSLFRVKGGGTLFSIELSSSLGEAALFIMRRSPTDARSVPAEIMLLPSAASFELEGGSWPAGLILPGLPPEFLEGFASSNRLVVKTRGKKSFEFTFAAADVGVSSLRACQNELLRSWGIDPTQFLALAQKPRPIAREEWTRNAQYPRNAARAGRRGMTVVRITVLPDGSVKNCATVATSGSSELDSEACRLLLKEARFEPAIGPDGKPAAAQLAYRVAWTMRD